MRILAAPAFKSRHLNPYQALLYEKMKIWGHEVEEYGRSEPRADIVHLHWHDAYVSMHNWRFYYRFPGQWLLLRSLKAGGAKVVWTIHDVQSLSSSNPLKRALYQALLRNFVDGAIALTEPGLSLAQKTLPWLRSIPCEVIPHGHYRSEYPNVATREESRKRLGLLPEEAVVLWFGRVRGYKNLPGLVRAFRGLNEKGCRLVVAGFVSDGLDAETESALKTDPRIVSHLRLIPAEEAQFYFNAADVCVLPYSETYNSGSAILSLSFSVPVVLPRRGGSEALCGAIGADWVRLFDGELGEDELRQSIAWAKNTRRSRTAPLESMEWEPLARRTLAFFEKLLGT